MELTSTPAVTHTWRLESGAAAPVLERVCVAFRFRSWLSKFTVLDLLATWLFSETPMTNFPGVNTIMPALAASGVLLYRSARCSRPLRLRLNQPQKKEAENPSGLHQDSRQRPSIRLKLRAGGRREVEVSSLITQKSTTTEKHTTENSRENPK